jgi:hypothetical protein
MVAYVVYNVTDAVYVARFPHTTYTKLKSEAMKWDRQTAAEIVVLQGWQNKDKQFRMEVA